MSFNIYQNIVIKYSQTERNVNGATTASSC
jgi:hypothetical protein